MMESVTASSKLQQMYEQLSLAFLCLISPDLLCTFNTQNQVFVPAKSPYDFILACASGICDPDSMQMLSTASQWVLQTELLHEVTASVYICHCSSQPPGVDWRGQDWTLSSAVLLSLLTVDFFHGLAGDVTRLSADKRFIFPEGVWFVPLAHICSNLCSAPVVWYIVLV